MDKQFLDKKIASPCVRNCCLDDADICLGCFRHLDEITGWQGFNEQEKIAILARCHGRKIQRKNTNG